MISAYTHINDLARQPLANGILSRRLYKDERIKVEIFGFVQGEELSEHTAWMPAILRFLQGEAKITLGDDAFDAKPGTWVHMPTGLRHSIQAKNAGGHAALVAEVKKGRRDVGSCRRGSETAR